MFQFVVSDFDLPVQDDGSFANYSFLWSVQVL
jgi:hypothetical protein